MKCVLPAAARQLTGILGIIWRRVEMLPTSMAVERSDNGRVWRTALSPDKAQAFTLVSDLSLR